MLAWALVAGLALAIVTFLVWTARQNRRLLEFANAAALKYIMSGNLDAKLLVNVAAETVTGDKMTGELFSVILFAKLSAMGQPEGPQKAAFVDRAEELMKMMYTAKSTLESSVQAKRALSKEAMGAWREFNLSWVNDLTGDKQISTSKW
jgi:hypothetical protein